MLLILPSPTDQRTDRSDVSGQVHLRMTIKIEGVEQNMASYHIQYQILHETLFNHLCEVADGVHIPPGTRKLKGDELDVSNKLTLSSRLQFKVQLEVLNFQVPISTCSPLTFSGVADIFRRSSSVYRRRVRHQIRNRIHLHGYDVSSLRRSEEYL